MRAPGRAGRGRAGAGRRPRCASSCPDVPPTPGQLRLAAARATGPTAFAAACEAAGVIVRPFAGDGVRVTIGTAEENDTFLAAAEKYRG